MALQDENVARAFAESLLVDLSSILQAEIGETLPMTWPVIAENQYPAEPSHERVNQVSAWLRIAERRMDPRFSGIYLGR